MAESLHISSGTGQVCFLMHLYGKNVLNVAQISFGTSLGQGNERLLKWLRSTDQDGRHAHIW